MYLVASFEHTIYLELFLTELEQKGIPRSRILAVPLDRRQEPRRLFDTIHRADGFSLFDVAAILGTCGMLLGAIYGFVLTWGPILWGLIGLIGGALVGFFVKWLFVRREARLEVSGRSRIPSEVMVMVRCEPHQADFVQALMWEHHAVGVGRLWPDAQPAPRVPERRAGP
ncbi:hypothetical protein [Alicyclobacillus sp.]|uniref:hypothetical protein n=1 Tax=Alicyclobacillus sp. TaxID=61169 RepID=UPI0025C72418|nr:hypothetical protein [Alicyclobacillus sp.]MCL6517443.1 hypothetical protein [Alicyclobacillus sp.]